MSRKPRFKVQRLNEGGLWDRRYYGNKRWTPVYDNNGNLGFTLNRQEADDLYWEMTELCPDQTYRIMEKR
ncbi:hypothetical protein phiGM223_10 [Pseudomonas phage phiGM22-3]|uniref:Uncharacterized protein n=1 Tax=Pseudomonas phage phiGM22-3 TaxID=2816462 RepID=A0A8T8IYT6_9CAUD|nr:hypothetical protein phiGM223_10 [Pseudomonas phage phiGM22-3]